MKIVVGCPIRDREWVWESWLEHVLAAFAVIDITPHFAFVIGDSRDNTQNIVTSIFREYSGMWTEEREPEGSHLAPGERKWEAKRYHHMVYLRNRLLDLVRALQPDFFLSIDSDILLHPSSIGVLLDHMSSGIPHNKERLYPNAISSKVYLATEARTVNYGFFNSHGGVSRQDQEGVFPVDILMALKLMDEKAYQIDYNFHCWGEDIGWSSACKDAGLNLVWDGRDVLASKHIMSLERLTQQDVRIGW